MQINECDCKPSSLTDRQFGRRCHTIIKLTNYAKIKRLIWSNTHFIYLSFEVQSWNFGYEVEITGWINLRSALSVQYVYFIDSASSIKTAGYWPSSLFAFLFSIKAQKDLRPCLFSTTTFLFSLLSFSFTLSVLPFSGSTKTEKSQKIFLPLQKIISAKENFRAPAWTLAKFYLLERNGQSRAGSIVPSCPLG